MKRTKYISEDAVQRCVAAWPKLLELSGSVNFMLCLCSLTDGLPLETLIGPLKPR